MNETTKHGIRFTRATEEIVRTMIRRHMENPNSEVFGLELAKATGYGAGTTYPILRRLENAGWLLSQEEKDSEAAPRSTPRPPRIYYRINPDALGAMRQRLAEVDARRRSEGSLVTGETSPSTPAWDASAH
ncbi:PadR family transcriptional regulator [Streptomyces pseudovenezuelae]|uniref:PadR family transcriptional regulator n=1 Tax=Streptomyces pseudovenezuelae TaxID=67350 RepID=UPI002E2ECCC6|nr:hypothetical protein [Streptomyces pseudovenezuelae]